MTHFQVPPNFMVLEEKTRCTRQDTRVHAWADSAIASWASDESQDSKRNGCGNGKHFLFLYIGYMRDWILDDNWVAMSAMCSPCKFYKFITFNTYKYLVFSIDFRISGAEVAGSVSFPLPTSQESRRNATLLSFWGGPHHVRPEWETTSQGAQNWGRSKACQNAKLFARFVRSCRVPYAPVAKGNGPSSTCKGQRSNDEF